MNYYFSACVAFITIIIIFIDDKFINKIEETKAFKKYLKYFIFVFISVLVTSYINSYFSNIEKKIPNVFTSEPTF